MKNLIIKAYLKSLLLVSILLLFIILFICYIHPSDGYFHIMRVIQGSTFIWLIWALPVNTFMFLSLIEKSKRTFKLFIVAGFISGIVLALAVRIGFALEYLLWLPNKTAGNLMHIFIDFWPLYLWMGLFGIVFMFLEHLFSDKIANLKVFKIFGFFRRNYSPVVLFYKHVLHRDLYKEIEEELNKDKNNKNPNV